MWFLLKQCLEPNRKVEFSFCVKYFNWNPLEKGLYVTLEFQRYHDTSPPRPGAGFCFGTVPDWFIDYSVAIQRNEDDQFKVINTELGKRCALLCVFNDHVKMRSFTLIYNNCVLFRLVVATLGAQAWRA